MFNFPRDPSFLEDYPQEAQRLLINRLNGKNLQEVLYFSSFISLYDYFDTLEYGANFFAPLINVEHNSLLAKAILKSKSKLYKSGIIEKEDIEFFYHRWLNITGYRKKEIAKNDGSESSVHRQFLALYNHQARFQNYGMYQREIRSYLLYYDIPIRFEPFLYTQFQDHYFSIPEVFEKRTGLTIFEFIIFGMLVMEQNYRIFRKILPEEKSKQTRKKFTEEFGDLREANNRFANHGFIGKKIDGLYIFYLQSKQFLNQLIVHSSITNDTDLNNKFRKYLELLSKDIYEIRRLIETDEKYQRGNLLDQLCPLERFPLIKLSEANFIIPNFRYFAQSITESIHYILQENFPGNEYNQILGSIQEIYIRELINSSYNSCVIIPEVEYQRGKEKVKSPDFSIIGDKLYIIESKSKRPTAELRNDPGSKIFEKEMENIADAFQKARSKLNDIYSEVGIFSSYHKELTKTKGKKPIVIIIIGEGFEIPMEILQYHVKYNDFGQLKEYPFDYIFANLSMLEEMVSISVNGKISITDVFDQFCVSSQTIETYLGTDQIIDEKFGKDRKFNIPLFSEKREEIIAAISVNANKIRTKS